MLSPLKFPFSPVYWWFQGTQQAKSQYFSISLTGSEEWSISARGRSGAISVFLLFVNFFQVFWGMEILNLYKQWNVGIYTVIGSN